MSKDLEMTRPMRRAQKTVSESGYEGGEGMGNAQLQYFKREINQGYYDKEADREAAERADILALGNLPVKKVDEDAGQDDAQVQMIDDTLLMQDDLIDDRKDKRPLAQLKQLQDKYRKHSASQMFLQNHREQLRKYVDKKYDFKGEIFFYKNFTYIFSTDNRIAEEGYASIQIQQVIIGDMIDFLPDGDIDVHDKTFQHIKKGAELKYFTIDNGDGNSKSPGKSKSPSRGAAPTGDPAKFRAIMAEAERSHRLELVQNGRFVYFWTTTTPQRGGDDFSGQGTTLFDLVEFDLYSGDWKELPEFRVKAYDSRKWVPLTAGFARRHAAKEFPYGDGAVKRDDFLQHLKDDVVCIREIRIAGDAPGMRASLRPLANSGLILWTLFEGRMDHKYHFVTAVNTEDLLRLQDVNIVNKLQVQAHERQAKEVGVLFITEDRDGVGYYNLVQVNRDTSGTATSCSKPDVVVDPERMEGFKQRVLSSNYRYLYDEQREEFFLRKSTPIQRGAIVISDMVMKKIIFLEMRQGKCRLKVTHMKNHGMSFQKISAQQIAMQKQYATFAEECLTLSNVLAQNLAQIDETNELKPQVVISRAINNMFRSEGSVYYLDADDDMKLKEYKDDKSFQVKSLSLLNTDYIANKMTRSFNDSLKTNKRSYITLVEDPKWYAKPFLVGTPARKQAITKYKRLASANGMLLLPRVTEVPVYDPNIGQNVSPNEPRVELFQFEVKDAIPTDAEEEVITQDRAWKLVHERVRFENDDSVQRPIIFCQSTKDWDENFRRQHFWFCIYDFQAERIVSQIHMNFPDLIIDYEIENIELAASTEIEQLAERSFCQKFQVAFYLKNQLRAKIIEYTVQWDYIRGRRITIEHTCSKEFILKQPEAKDTSVEAFAAGLKKVDDWLPKYRRPPLDDEPVYMIPYFDKSNQISGTQLIYGGASSPRIFIFDSYSEESALKKSRIPFVINEGYKIFKNETYADYTAVLAYSRLSRALLDDDILTGQEKVEVIEDSVKAILNSVVFDPSLAFPWQLKTEQVDSKFLKAIDLGRGIEVLEWFSLVSLKCTSPDLQQIFDEAKREYEGVEYDKERYGQPSWLTLSGLMERVMVNDLINQTEENKLVVSEGQQLDYDRIRSLQLDAFYIKGHEIIQRDIFLNHPLHYLFEIEKESAPMDAQVDMIMKFTFSEANNSHMTHHMEAQEHLMSMVEEILERDNPQQTYFDNFLAQKSIADPTSRKAQSESLNIAQELSVASMPPTLGVPLQCFPYTHANHEFRQAASYTVDQYLQQQELTHGWEHPVECLFLDLRFLLFERKIKHIKEHIDENGEIMSSCHNPRLQPEFTMTSFDLANLTLDIVEKTEGDIRKQKAIRHIINFQYADTRKVNKYMLIGYAIGFFIPFFIQMYVFVAPVVLACNSVCMLTSLLLMRFEIEQLRLQGCAYFASFMNWIDLMGFFSYSFYFALRVQDPSLQMPDYKQNWEEDTLTFLSFPLIMYTSQKLLFYFKMFEQFGLFQALVSATIADIKVFLPFMFFWIFIFSCQLQALGASYPLGDYPDLMEFVAVLIQTWRNSLANVAVPDYSRWSDNLRNEEKEGSYGLYSYVMIFLIWTIWYLNLLFILLVLTNFLISIVGNAYGKAIDEDVEIIYALKSDLNQEVSLFNKWQGRVQGMDSLIIVGERETVEGADEKICDIADSLRVQHETTQTLRKRK